jgi:hypothetical protein
MRGRPSRYLCAGGEDLRCDVGEQPIRQTDRLDRAELEYLPLDRLPADVAGLLTDRCEQVDVGHLGSVEQRVLVLAAAVLLAPGSALSDQSEHPGAAFAGTRPKISAVCVFSAMLFAESMILRMRSEAGCSSFSSHR